MDSKREKVTIQKIVQKIEDGKKISMLALYDYPFAVIAERAGVDSIIVGDSVSMVLYGDENTLRADMDMMIRHTRAVRKGAPSVFLIGDMPFMSYQPSVELAIKNGGRFLAEGGADAVKLEGGRDVVEVVRALVKSSIPVVGHLGLLPQSIVAMGGFKVQGREARSAYDIVLQARELEDAGICMLILECVPAELAEEIVKRVSVPVIGIGSGPACQGQVQILYDILGLYPRFKPKFVKLYANLADKVEEAVRRYVEEVNEGIYPVKPDNVYSMRSEEYDRLLDMLKGNTGE